MTRSRTTLNAALTAVPSELREVALIDAHTCAATGDMSISWWYDEVRAGRAPQPVIRKPRCTRWRVSEVRDFWAGLVEHGIDGADKLAAAATKASAIAQAKRAAKRFAAEAREDVGHAD
jgi:predicted DNA-binding transcriptional regulator AlpA